MENLKKMAIKHENSTDFFDQIQSLSQISWHSIQNFLS